VRGYGRKALQAITSNISRETSVTTVRTDLGEFLVFETWRKCRNVKDVRPSATRRCHCMD